MASYLGGLARSLVGRRKRRAPVKPPVNPVVRGGGGFSSPKVGAPLAGGGIGGYAGMKKRAGRGKRRKG